MLLKELRKRKNLSQKKVAEDMGISQNALCQYEKGIRNPRPELLVRFADYFGCTIDELIRGGENGNEVSN